MVEAILTSTYNLFFEQKYEKYQNFLSENFHFLVVIFEYFHNAWMAALEDLHGICSCTMAVLLR